MQGKIAMSAQDTISYKEMRPDGICIVTDNYYTKTIHFFDINYQLATDDDKDSIFGSYSKFLNHFDKSIQVQLSFLNQSLDISKYEKAVYIAPQNDKFDYIRKEYNDMLNNQLAKGNNGIEKRKYVTFGIYADNIQDAKHRLESIETNIINKFKSFGVRSYSLNGIERLELLYKCFNENETRKFKFSWNMIAETGLTTKDFIAPSSFYFPKDDGQVFKIGNTYGAVSVMEIISTELWDDVLKEYLDLQSSISVNIHFQSIDQAEAVKMVKRKLTDINKMKIDEQKKAVRSGYDMDIIPTDINSFGGDALGLLEALQSHNERLFKITIFIMNTAKTKKELARNVFTVQSIGQERNCPLRRLDFQQEAGLMASVPIGINEIEIERAMPTRGLAIFTPFTTQELFSESNEALYCGLNAISNNIIMVDRKDLRCPNGLILGSPGSGKSFFSKREITNVFLVTKDDIFISDPEAEYAPLVRALHGQVIKLSPNSTDHINPMDINLNYSEGENPLALYAIYLLSKGNRDYLFADDIYSNITQSPYDDYTIPGEALNDETFRKLITEAEKYLGYPYVWGGSSPSTSFDCSGFVCWVYRNSGVYPLSRTTAQGVFNQCSAVRPSEAKPGDLIFFTGTYNSGCPVSHIGIYVGNGMMIHCGNPIQYASVNSSYWSSHFYAYGRLGSN